MSQRVSPRIAQALEALPLQSHFRVLEIGCGPGVAARLVSRQLTSGMILAIDRSKKAIDAACRGSADEMATGRLDFRCVAIEDFVLEAADKKFDLAFAMRVGALDGRHPELADRALGRLRRALKPDGVLVIDAAPPVAAADLPAFIDFPAKLP